jgi:UDP-N-acetylmuramoylalanine--D-glutamate ligase
MSGGSRAAAAAPAACRHEVERRPQRGECARGAGARRGARSAARGDDRGAQKLSGLPHRSQWVAQVRGVTYINDSKGTNVGATLAAVGGMNAPVVLIAGGEGKNQDFAPLGPRCAASCAMPFSSAAPPMRSSRPCRECARSSAARRSRKPCAPPRAPQQPGDAVLLSPACASLDMFSDYAQRGAVFMQAVRELAA